MRAKRQRILSALRALCGRGCPRSIRRPDDFISATVSRVRGRRRAFATTGQLYSSQTTREVASTAAVDASDAIDRKALVVHHNLWAHNASRNPRLGDNYGRPPYPIFDVRNNVIYDYGEIASGLTQGVLKVNYVANYIRPGPSSKLTTPIHIGAPSNLSFYIKDNLFEGNSALTTDNSQFFDPVTIDRKRQVQTVDQPFAAPPVSTTSARAAFDSVLATAGASLPRRDSVDARIVAEVRSRKGSIIDSQQQVGGGRN